MLRYSIAFPLLCNHFSRCVHPMCPEEVSPAAWGDDVGTWGGLGGPGGPGGAWGTYGGLGGPGGAGGTYGGLGGPEGPMGAWVLCLDAAVEEPGTSGGSWQGMEDGDLTLGCDRGLCVPAGCPRAGDAL